MPIMRLATVAGVEAVQSGSAYENGGAKRVEILD